MLLSQTAQYALRVMTHLAVSQGGAPLRAKEISQGISSPPPYVSKVLRKLVEANLLRAEKGHGGGFSLSRPPQEILFCEILAAVQAPKIGKQCIFGWRKCDPESPCVLHHRWNSVSSTFDTWAKTTSLADIQEDANKTEWLTKPPNFN